MYHNVSRGASPSSASRASKIDLENIEELQDAWCRRYEMLRDPPAPPELNSPRSLRACTIGSVNPHYTLQKLSLKQHLFRVLGNANMLSTLPTPSSTEYKVLMQSALRSFQEVAVGLGTSQEKLAAYIAFRNQEELRTLHIVSLRELRRQLVAEEVYADRKRHHPQPRRSSRDGGTSARSNASASHRGSSAHSLNSGQEGMQGSAPLWSSKVVEEKERSRHASVSSLQDSTVNVSGHPISPITTTLSASLRSRAPFPHHHGEAATNAVDSGSVTPPAKARIGAAAAGGALRGTADVTPMSSPAGKLPYKPRDVASLNSSYFGNRSIQSNASNPSGAPLPTATSTNTSATEQTPRRPVLAQKHARYPLVPPQPTQNLHSSLAEGAGDADREVSIEAAVTHDSVPKQDLSVVSLNSNQLEVLLNPKETSHTFKALPPGAMSSGGVGAGDKDAAQHAVKLFHEGDATSAAAAAAGEPATTAADGQRITGGVLTPSSQPLTPRRRSGFTNHLNSPKKLVPNVFPRTTTAAVGSDHPAATAANAAAAQASVQSTSPSQLIAASSSFRGEVEADTSAIVDAAALLWTVPPPPLSLQERQEGFVYYCANVTRNVTKLYGGARFPIAGAVQL